MSKYSPFPPGYKITRFDRMLVSTVVALSAVMLCVFGLMMINSATMGSISTDGAFTQQMKFLALCLFLLWVDVRMFRRPTLVLTQVASDDTPAAPSRYPGSPGS